MTIFAWLLLGHLLGDWLLQSDWMALGKRRGLITRAGLAHFAVYTATILGVVWLAAGSSLDGGRLLITGLIIFTTHWLIDATNLVQGWMALAGQRNQVMVRLMIDQTLHLLVLGIVAQLFLAGVG